MSSLPPNIPPTDLAPAPVAAAPARGILPWAMGFLVMMPIPFLGAIVSGVCMAVTGGGARRAGGVARENARSALNWGLTYLVLSTILLVLHFVLLFSLTADGPVPGFFPLGIPITLYLLLGVLHVVVVIVGTVRASGGTAMRVPFAIPFLRR
jgi:hypothetical protein